MTVYYRLLTIQAKTIGLSLGHFLVSYSYDEKVTGIGSSLGNFFGKLEL